MPTALKDKRFEKTVVKVPARDKGRFLGPLAQPSGKTQAHCSGPQSPHPRMPIAAVPNLTRKSRRGCVLKGRRQGPTSGILVHGSGTELGVCIFNKLSQVTPMCGTEG